MNSLKVDFTKTTGRKIKPLHGINNCPLDYYNPIPEFIEFGIPYCRLHDTGGAYGRGILIDVPNVFPDFNADPEDPAAYDFVFTDALLKNLKASGCEIVYRLGVTIETARDIQVRRINPPSDYNKWAKICEHIIRHYNEGWANGLFLNIKYWEIWNEPDNKDMWTGTDQEYFELYRVTSNYLKSVFPHLKFGGYAACGFYAIDNPDDERRAPWLKYFHDFCKYITAPETGAVLDFFSWHIYTNDLDRIARYSVYAAEQLKLYGLGNAEIILNEWNVMDTEAGISVFDAMRNCRGASFVAAAFCLLQASPVDKAMYYDGQPMANYGAIWENSRRMPSKTFYIFRMFNELYKLGTENSVEITADNNDIYALAASNENTGKKAVLAVNRAAHPQIIKFDTNGCSGKGMCFITDNDLTFTENNLPLFKDGEITMSAFSVMLIRFD